jgi:hypothetical protein
MTGSVFFVVIAVAISAALTFSLSPLFIIPGVMIVVFALFAGPLAAALRSGDAGSGAEVPTSGEASYDPVVEPGQRAV